MKKSISYLILSLLLISCSNEVEAINYNVDIDEVFSFSEDTFTANKNALTDSPKENIKNYFTKYASHLSGDSTYIFIYDGEQNSKDLHITVTYYSNKEENPYLLACKWYLNDRNSYPNAYYFYSSYCEITDFKSIKHNPYYYYESNKDSNEAYVEINYTEIVYDNTKINSATFSIGDGTSMPSRGIKKTQELGNEALTTVNALYSFLLKLLATVDNNITL